jgi:phospholipase/lecithinase/hemolysin
VIHGPELPAIPSLLLVRSPFSGFKLVVERTLPRLIHSLIIFAAFSLMSSSAQSLPAFNHVVVFGDSLSDNGNAGRASNGPVWVEHLASRFGLTMKPSRTGGLNFAVGGARLDPLSGSTSLQAQASAYLQTSRPHGRILHIVYGGGNDLLAAIGQPQALAMVDTAVASLRSIVANLVHQGATDILVPNLPAIGITPAVRAQGSQAIEAANQLAARFNSAIDQALSGFAGRAGLRLYRLDVWQLAERVRADPAAAGFVDIASPCSQHRRCEGYLFWDDVHPTTQAHRRLADAAAQVLEAP